MEKNVMWYSKLIPVRRMQNLNVVLYLRIEEERLKKTFDHEFHMKRLQTLGSSKK